MSNTTPNAHTQILFACSSCVWYEDVYQKIVWWMNYNPDWYRLGSDRTLLELLEVVVEQVERKLSIINSSFRLCLFRFCSLSLSRSISVLVAFFNLPAPETKRYNWFEQQEVSCELTRKSFSTNLTNLKCCNQYLSNFGLTNVFSGLYIIHFSVCFLQPNIDTVRAFGQVFPYVSHC